MSGVASEVMSADDVRLLPLFTADFDGLKRSFGHLDSVILWGGDALRPVASTLTSEGVRVIHAPSRPPEDRPQHVAAYLRETIPGGARVPHDIPQLTASLHELAWLDSAYPRLAREPFLLIHPGSGGSHKNWIPERFAYIANRSKSHLGLGVVLLAGPAEAKLLSEVESHLDDPSVQVVQDVSLEKVAALLTRARFYLGNDSGISHLAGCLGTRGVVLFGPTSARMWAPLGRTTLPMQAERMEDFDAHGVLNLLKAQIEPDH
jgi:ADP-heptose:LPS heptosyltransferase